MRVAAGLAIALVLLAGDASTRAQTAEVPPPIDVGIENPLSNVLRGELGFHPSFVRLYNRGAAADQVTIKIQHWGNPRAEIVRRLRLAPGERALVDLPCPSWFRYLTLDAASQRFGPLETSSISLTRAGRRSRSTWTATPAVGVVVVDDVPIAPGKSLTTTPDGTELEGLGLDPGAMPTKWMSWLGVGMVMVRGRALTAVSAAQRNALDRYVELGGIVVVYDAASLTDAARRTAFPAAVALSDTAVQEYGLGRLFYSHEPDASAAAAAMASLVAPAGTSGELEMRADARLQPRALDPLAGIYGPGGWGGARPPTLPGIGEVPATPFALLILLFALVVGPINFLVLRRLGRRVWALVTIPVISLAAFLLLILYSVFVEGLDVKVLPRSAVWLDQTTERAVLVSHPAYYAGLAPSDGLRFDGQTAAVPLTERRTSLRHARHDIDWTDGLHLGPGWLPARTPTEILLLTSGPCRQRLEVTPGGPGELSLTNALDADILHVVLRSLDGVCYSRGGLARGESGVAVAGAAPSALFGPFEKNTVLETWRHPTMIAGEALLPGTYVAVVDRAIVGSYGMDDVTMLPGFHFIRGRHAAPTR